MTRSSWAPVVDVFWTHHDFFSPSVTVSVRVKDPFCDVMYWYMVLGLDE